MGKTYAVVLPAGGLGRRMGAKLPKQLLELNGKPVYLHSLETFLEMEEIAEVALAVPAEWKAHFEAEVAARLAPELLQKLKLVVGGEERWLSVRRGVEALDSGAEFVLVHDVARPFLSKKIIAEIFEALERGPCIVAKACPDTVKVARNGKIERTLDRNTIWLAQTPQCCKISLLKELYQKIDAEPLSFTPTDEASILEHFGEPVYIVQGDSMNDKLTTPEDLARFAQLQTSKNPK